MSFSYDPKPENIHCRRNTENTRRLSSASSQAARSLGRTAATRAVEWTSRTPCRKIPNAKKHTYESILRNRKEHRPKQLWELLIWDLSRELTSVAGTGVDCDMCTRAGLAGLLASVYAVKPFVEVEVPL